MSDEIERLVSTVRELMDRNSELVQRVEELETSVNAALGPSNPLGHNNAIYRQSVVYPIQVTSVNSSLSEISGKRLTAHDTTTWGVNSLLATKPITAKVAGGTMPDSGAYVTAHYLGNINGAAKYGVFGFGGAEGADVSQAVLVLVRTISSGKTYHCKAYPNGPFSLSTSILCQQAAVATTPAIPSSTWTIAMKTATDNYYMQVPVWL